MSRYDLVLAFGMVSMIVGASAPVPVPVATGLIAGGPILIGMGLGLRWDRPPPR